MKPIVRAGLAPAVFLLAGVGAGVAAASPGPVRTPALPPMPANLPAACRAVGFVPPSATTLGPALAARISVANCTAEVAMNRVTVAPDATSIAQLDLAVAPSLTLLDGVIAHGAPYWSMIAEDAKRDLYTSMIVRERSSIGDADPAVHAALEPRLARWQDGAARAGEAIAVLEHDNPRIGDRDAVIGHITWAVSRAERREARDAAAIAALDRRIARDRFLERAFWASNSRTPLATAWRDQRVAQRERADRERDLRVTETAVAQGWVR
jgi:hypothetical protein